jgi:hypothetical protein
LLLVAERVVARSTGAVAAAGAMEAEGARAAQAEGARAAEAVAEVTARVAAAVAKVKADAEAEVRAAAGEAEAAAQAAEAGRTKGLMSDVYYEIARRAGEMEGVVGDVGNAGDDGIVSRAAMLRCVRDVIKEATLRALSASKPAEEGVEKGEGVEEGESTAA